MTKKVMNETEEEITVQMEAAKSEYRRLTEELEELKKEFPETSSYKFEGSADITMYCTINSANQKEAEELATELFTKSMAWAINFTEQDIESGNIFDEFEYADQIESIDISPFMLSDTVPGKFVSVKRG